MIFDFGRSSSRSWTLFRGFAAAWLVAAASGACGNGSTGGDLGGLANTAPSGLGHDGAANPSSGQPPDAGAIPMFGAKQTDLVSDQADAGATTTDPNLVNAWGLAFTPTGIAWISDNGTGLATVYGTDGTIVPLVVTVPTTGDGGGTSAPTGMVFNPSTDFAGDTFIMDTEDGTVAGWRTGTTAAIRVDRSGAGAKYKGLALINAGGANILLAANFAGGTVDIFDRNYRLISAPTAFADSTIPAGFAPFNVASVGNNVVVMYAKQDAQKADDVPGVGNGYVNVFDKNGNMVQRLVSGGVLNSPWGVALAPATFGPLANMLLIGNFGDGKINAYDAASGQLRGQLGNASGVPLAIDGLWALVFQPSGVDAGSGGYGGPSNADAGTPQLFFTAGPAQESHGLFGRIDLLP